MLTAVHTGATIPEVEALRGIAIVLVFLVHAEALLYWNARYQPGEPLGLLRAITLGGHTGVSLFFVLSGFLLSRPFLAEMAGNRPVDRGAYYWRRAFRILPLYVLAVVTTTALCAREPADFARGLRQLVFLGFTIEHESRLVPLFTGVWWTIETEVQFYLLLPLLPLAVRSRRGRVVGAAALAVYGVWYTAFACGAARVGSLSLQHSVAHSLLGRAPLFGFGLLGALLYERYGARVRTWAARQRWLAYGGADMALVVATLALIAYLRSMAVTLGRFEMEVAYPAWHLPEGFLWMTILLLCVLAPLRGKVLLANRVLRTIGLLSYSIYLLHMPILVWGLRGLRLTWPGTFVGWSGPSIAATIGLGLLCVACAAVSYRWIEQPMIRYGRRLIAARTRGRDFRVVSEGDAPMLPAAESRSAARAA